MVFFAVFNFAVAVAITRFTCFYHIRRCDKISLKRLLGESHFLYRIPELEIANLFVPCPRNLSLPRKPATPLLSDGNKLTINLISGCGIAFKSQKSFPAIPEADRRCQTLTCCCSLTGCADLIALRNR